MLSKCSSTAYFKFEVSIYVFELGTNEGDKLGLKYGRVLGKTIGAADGLPLGTYDVSDLGLS